MSEPAKIEYSGMHGRYLLAVVLFVVLALAGLLSERQVVDNSSVYGERINTAGRQRMLSQRVTQLAYAAQTDVSLARYSEIMADLRDARDQLLAGHQELVAYRGDVSQWSPALERAYYEAPSNIDARIRKLVADVDVVLSMPWEQRAVTLLPTIEGHNLSLDASYSLLRSLDEAVTLYERRLDDELSRLNNISLLVFAVDIIALLLIGALVFWPIVRQFQTEHRNQQKTYRKLLDQMAERHQLDRERSAAEARFRIAFENAPIGIGLVYADGRVFDANPALARMFPEAELDERFYFDSVLTDADAERYRALAEKVRKTASVQSCRMRCSGLDSEQKYLMVNLSPVSEKRDGVDYLVLQVEDITESHSLNTQLEYQASYDELTGLMNRRAFNREVEEAWNASNPGKRDNYLLMMDLDQFKIINDTSGHAAGDQLLRRVGEVIKECVRSDDLVCRLGGDEFGVVLLNCPGVVAKRIAETIRTALEDLRFSWGNETYRIGVSIGGVAIDPSMGDVSEIQQLADSACYAAKEAGRNNVQMVSEGKDDARRHRRQIRWVQRIRDAMERNRFAIYAQPIQAVDAEADPVRRVEVLIRLRDSDERRLIPPGAFLPAAERYGLNVELDEWVVSNLIQTLFVHRAVNAEPVRYWVNLSGNSVGDERFAARLIDIMKASPLPPGTLNFEITETAVIRNIAAAGQLMNELREMGSQLALDDFGTGLSSFGYLKHLPIDLLKIDGSFIRDIESESTNRIFVKSIIDIAHSLGIKTVAEFVETDRIASIVSELGADYLQGYAISRPYVLAPELPANDFVAHRKGVAR